MDKNYDSLKLGNQICFPIYAAAREIVKKYSPLLKDVDLTYTQYITMMVMWEEKKATAAHIGERLFLDSGTLTPLLKTLERKGLVIRRRSEKDERVLEVVITEEGERLKEKALKAPENMAKCLDLTKEEAEFLYKTMYKILGR